MKKLESRIETVGNMQRTYGLPSPKNSNISKGGLYEMRKQARRTSIAFLINDDDDDVNEEVEKKKMVLPMDSLASKDSWRITLPPIHFPEPRTTVSLSSDALSTAVYEGEQNASSILPSEVHSNYETPMRRNLISNLSCRRRSTFDSPENMETNNNNMLMNIDVPPPSSPRCTAAPQISESTLNYISKLLQQRKDDVAKSNGDGIMSMSREELARQTKRYKNRISVQKCRRKSRERQLRLEYERKMLRRENAFLQQLKRLVEKSGVLKLVPKKRFHTRENSGAASSQAPPAVPMQLT